MQVRIIPPAAMALCVALASQVTASEQQPDLSGTWQMVGHQEESLHIIQSDSGMLVTRRTEFSAHKEDSWQVDLRYAFDGSETWSSWALPNGSEWTETASAHWVDDALQIKIAWKSSRGDSEFSERYYLNEDMQLIREQTGIDIVTGLAGTTSQTFARVVP